MTQSPHSEAGETSAPSSAQARYLVRGLDQPGGKLPLFDVDGQRVSERTIWSCLRKGWAAPWYRNPIKPDWLVCRLTDAGRAALADGRAHEDDEADATV